MTLRYSSCLCTVIGTPDTGAAVLTLRSVSTGHWVRHRDHPFPNAVQAMEATDLSVVRDEIPMKL